MTHRFLRLATVGLAAVATPAPAHQVVRSEGTHAFAGDQARGGSGLAFLESLNRPNGKTVNISFGDPNAN